jgi:hypothetical protein
MRRGYDLDAMTARNRCLPFPGGATIVGGTPTADGDETSAVQWWAPSGFPRDEMNTLTRALLRDVRISEEDSRDWDLG